MNLIELIAKLNALAEEHPGLVYASVNNRWGEEISEVFINEDQEITIRE